MKAMILAAGLGTRLKPETNHKPKALINVFGKPMISLLIDRLTGYGYTTIVVNVHHHADMLIHYLNKRHADINLLISDERTQLLDTGGALKKAKDMLSGDEPVLVHNVDVLTDIDLHDLNKKHLQNNAMATLVVQQRESPRGLLFSNNNQLCGRDTGSQIITVDKPKGQLKKLAFSGIQVLSPNIFNFFPKKNIFSIIEFYLEVAKTERIQGITFDKQQWFDLGSREKIDAAEKNFYQKQYP